MGSIGAVFDTNILIDNLHGFPTAASELARFSDKAISIITWIEIMTGTTELNEADTRLFLANFICLPLTTDIAEQAAVLRRQRRIKLPDAIIQATARVTRRLLVTRNTRDFSDDDPGVRFPYQI